jgi:hypothetical protein
MPTKRTPRKNTGSVKTTKPSSKLTKSSSKITKSLIKKIPRRIKSSSITTKSKTKQYGGNNILEQIQNAINEDDIELFEDILKQSINPNTVLLNDKTILNTVIDNDYVWGIDFVKILLTFEVRLDYTNTGDKPIIRALKRLDPDILFLLLRNGASLPKNRENRKMLLDTIYRLEPPHSERLNYFNWRDTFIILYSQLKEDIRLENAQFNTNLVHRSGFSNDILKGISENHQQNLFNDLSEDRINTHMGVYLDSIM